MNLAGYQNSQLGFSAFSKWGERKKQEAIEKARQKELRKREEEAKREAEAKKDKFHTNLLSTAQELIKPITGGHMLKPKIVGERTIEILNKKTLEQEHLEQLERERPQFPTYFKDVKTIQEIIDRFYALEKSDNIQHLDSGIAMLVGATSEGSLFQKELKPALKELRERLLERRKKILNPTPAPAPTP
ncbi:MAG: hypothetical protein Q3983_10270, partial [Capnocytophaga sp.]|nr:hypothetical protein [Capnocytophaga sp.]